MDQQEHESMEADVDLPDAGSGLRRTADAGLGRPDVDPWRRSAYPRVEGAHSSRLRCSVPAAPMRRGVIED
jgi:hypothetical protein